MKIYPHRPLPTPNNNNSTILSNLASNPVDSTS